MHKFLKNFYYIITVITLIFLLKINYAISDGTLISLNATAKHYCTCIFISNMDKEYCDSSYDLIMSASTDEDLLKQIKMLGYKADFEKEEIIIEYEGYEIKSTFSEKTGCYFKK
tara:strand:- start:935 stop:1276 length:342 start_codon:yes stop_codon:yes gene_type:complete